MSKAFKCDNCGEYREGSPSYIADFGTYEICSNCYRMLKIFANVDPFDRKNAELLGVVEKEEKE